MMPFARSRSPLAAALMLVLSGAILLISLGPNHFGSGQQSNGVQALKLPSFFSWMQQPQSSAQQQQQQIQGLQMSMIAKPAQHSTNNLDPVDQMMTSGSQFEPSRAPPLAAQHPSPLRRPFQSILMLPSKSSHQIHLLTSLPKSLFGRFLSGGSSSSGSVSTNQIPAVQAQQMVQQPASVAQQQPWMHAPDSGAQTGETRTPRFIQSTSHMMQGNKLAQHRPMALHQSASDLQFSRRPEYLRPVMRPHSRPRAPPVEPSPEEQASGYPIAEEPTKHALGFGESGDFIMMEPHSANELHAGAPAPDNSEAQQQQRELDQLQGDSMRLSAAIEKQQQQQTNEPIFHEISALSDGQEPQGGNMTVSPGSGDGNKTSEVSSEQNKDANNQTPVGSDNTAAVIKNDTQIISTQASMAQNSSETSEIRHEVESVGKVLLALNETQVAGAVNQTSGGPVRVGKRPEVEASERQHQQVADQQGGLESATAAIIVAPADGQSIGEQLASEEQIESFILGPYKGLTSDTDLASLGHQSKQQSQQSRVNVNNGGEQRFQAAIYNALDRNQHQAKQSVGMTSMASNLIQQAKSLIQLPFVHMAAASSGQGNLFRGQSSGGRHAQPIDLLKESQAFVTATNEQVPGLSQSPVLAANNYQPQQQQQPPHWPPANSFYGARNAAPGNKAQLIVGAWPAMSSSSHRQQQPNLRAQSLASNPQSATNLQPIHSNAAGLQQRQADHNNHAAGGYYFVQQQGSFGQRPGRQQPRAPMRHQEQPLVPYFVEQQQLQPPTSQQQHHFAQQPVQQEFTSHLVSQQQQSPQANGYSLVIDHQSQQQRQHNRQPTHYYAEQTEQQQLFGPQKFKSGLYQIDPPKLTDEQQQQLAVPDSEDEAEAEKQLRAMAGEHQQQAQVQQEASGVEPGEEGDEEDEQQQAATEPTMEVSPEQFTTFPTNNSLDANSSRINEQQPEQQVEQQTVAVPQQVDDQTGGQRLSETKSMKMTQDITLYDFEMPAQGQKEPSPRTSGTKQQQRQQVVGGRQSLASVPAATVTRQQPQHQAAEGISFLDTQVYTIPFTLPVQQPVAPVMRGRGPVPLASGRHSQYSHGHFHYPQPMHKQPQAQQPQLHQRPAHLGQFPLPYLAPPGPQPKAPQHPGGLMTASSGFRSQRQPIGQALFKALYQELGGQEQASHQLQHQQIARPHTFNQSPQAPSAPALTIQTLDPNEEQFQQLEQPKLPQGGRKQHYFHYQPVMVQLPVRNYQMKQELPRRDSFGINQHQYMLAVTHRPTQVPVTTTTTSSITTARPEEESTVREAVATTTTTAAAAETEPQTQQRDIETTSISPVTLAQEMTEDEREDSLVQAMINKERQQQQQQQEDVQDSRQIQQASSIGAQVPSSPSAFCADRAPGLYADESQKCKAYYQCAPTGHQMFRCNNQTQFNQKTQNCDWWYNVNCGGTRSNQPEFGDQTTQRQPSTGDKEAAFQQNKQQIGSQESETTVHQQISSNVPSKVSDNSAVGDSSGWTTTKQEPSQLPQVTSRLDDEQQDSLQYQLTSQSFGQPTANRQQSDENQINNSEQQQMAPTSATPLFAVPQPTSEPSLPSSTLSLTEEHQQSMTTQEPIAASSSSSLDGNSLSEIPVGEARPQVGAILSDELLQTVGQAVASTQAPTSGSVGDSSNSETTPASQISETTQSSMTSTSSSQDNTSQQQSTTATPSTGEGQTQSPGTSNDEQPPAPKDDQQQQQEEITNQQPQRLLVQSEFGLGVQQQQREGGNTKSARSTQNTRFEFTRRQAANLERSNLFTGSLSPSGKGGEISDSNKYSMGLFDQGEAAEGPILFTTSANQGSVSYMPLDQVQYLTAQGVLEAATADAEATKTTITTTPQPSAISTSSAVGDPSVFSALDASNMGPLSKQRPKLERRSGFGARLMSIGNKSDKFLDNRQQTPGVDVQNQQTSTTATATATATTTSTTSNTTTKSSR